MRCAVLWQKTSDRLSRQFQVKRTARRWKEAIWHDAEDAGLTISAKQNKELKNRLLLMWGRARDVDYQFSRT